MTTNVRNEMMKTSTKIVIAMAVIGSLGINAYAADGGNPKKVNIYTKKNVKPAIAKVAKAVNSPL
ncbi:hypothetical protein LFREDSHE_05410 [Shewanella baltica]